jgi:hypothetical protein
MDRHDNLFLADDLACLGNYLDGARRDFCASESQRTFDLNV